MENTTKKNNANEISSKDKKVNVTLMPPFINEKNNKNKYLVLQRKVKAFLKR